MASLSWWLISTMLPTSRQSWYPVWCHSHHKQIVDIMPMFLWLCLPSPVISCRYILPDHSLILAAVATNWINPGQGAFSTLFQSFTIHCIICFFWNSVPEYYLIWSWYQNIFCAELCTKLCCIQRFSIIWIKWACEDMMWWHVNRLPYRILFSNH